MLTNRRLFILVAIIIVLLPTLACNSNKEAENPKLDYNLELLAQANKRGEAESFAAKNGIKLKDDKVDVTIYFASGQGETAAKAVTDAGGELKSTYNNGVIFSAFVPITKLEALSKEQSIRRIEVSTPPVPLGTN